MEEILEELDRSPEVQDLALVLVIAERLLALEDRVQERRAQLFLVGQRRCKLD